MLKQCIPIATLNIANVMQDNLYVPIVHVYMISGFNDGPLVVSVPFLSGLCPLLHFQITLYVLTFIRIIL